MSQKSAKTNPPFAFDIGFSRKSHFPLFRPRPRGRYPQKERRHIRNQSTPACKIWRESARGLSRNRWQKTNKKNSKTNTSPFALTSEWRVKTSQLWQAVVSSSMDCLPKIIKISLCLTKLQLAKFWSFFETQCIVRFIMKLYDIISANVLKSTDMQ